MLKSFQGNVLLGVMQQTSPRATATSREGVFSPYSCLFAFHVLKNVLYMWVVWTEPFFVLLVLFL